MPQFPGYETQVSARTGRTRTDLLTGNTSPNAFGANVGAALQQSAQQGMNTAQDIYRISATRAKETAATEIAKQDFTPRELEIRNEVGPDGAGYRDRTISEYRNWVEDTANGIEDDAARKLYKEKQYANLETISARAAVYEDGLKTKYSKDQANQGLSTLLNKITSDPINYEMYVTQGNDIIDTRQNITASLREGMKTSWRQDSAKNYFSGRISTATTPQDLDAIEADLSGRTEGGKDWTQDFLPQDYINTANLVSSTRKSMRDAVRTNAKAGLVSLEERSTTNPTLIPESELKAAQENVKLAQDGPLNQRMASIMDKQNVIRVTQRLPSSEIRARINVENGNPGMAYPNVPPRVSSAINKAANTFGVSAAFLGGTAQREYGMYLKAPRAKTDVKFKPQILNANVDTRNIRGDVLQAVTVAGQDYGSPLMISSIPNKDGSGVDISTVGMSEENKMKVVSSLVDSGFTGVDEVEGALRVSFRNKVADNFGEKDGKFWSGETYLSTSIAKVLEEKGFKAGVSAGDIKRTKPFVDDDTVDYSKPTAVKNEQGQPTTSAVGLMQFTKDTFLQTIKDPAVAGAIGIKVEGVSDEELLKLRADPEISTMAAAAYASKNKKMLERTFGRPVTDTELYAAHFMGPGGATSFISAYDNNPDQSAAALMPAAAKANPKMFFDGKREKTVGEVYSDLSNNFDMSPSRVSYERVKTMEKVADITDKEVKDDMMAHAMRVGSHTVAPLDGEGGFALRGSTFMSVAEYNHQRISEQKPFTKDEESFLKKQIEEGNADDNIQLFAQIQSMGDAPSRAAMKQLDTQDATFAHAGDLYLQGMAGVAGDIIRGQKRIKDNPAILQQIGATEQDVNDAFVKAAGSALADIKPERRQIIQDTALAYYAQKYGDVSVGSFDTKKFSAAVQAVMGGDENDPSIDVVNGEPTFLPRGITSDTMDQALQNMTVEDYTAMSEQGVPPRYNDGAIVNPASISGEVILRALGGGRYTLMLADGTRLVTGNIAPDGRAEAFVFIPDKDKLNVINKRPTTLAQSENFAARFGGMFR
jgi:hypothetical protein